MGWVQVVGAAAGLWKCRVQHLAAWRVTPLTLYGPSQVGPSHRPLLTALPCLLAIVTAAYAELIAISVTSPAPGLNVPATSAFPIEYTVSTPPLFTTISALSITCDNKVVNANAPVTSGKQSLTYVIPSDTKAGPINLVFTESTYINGTIIGGTSILTIQLIVPGTATSSTPPASSSVPPVVVPSSTSAPPPSSSASPSSSSATPPSSSASPTSSSAGPNTRTSVSPSVSGQTTLFTTIASMGPNGTAIGSVSPTASEPAASSAPQQTGVIIGSVCGFVAILAAGFGYAFLSKTRKNRRKDRVFGDDGPSSMPPPAPFDSPRAVGGVIGVPAPAATAGEERPDSWEPEVTHAPGALYNTTAAAGGYYPQQQYGAYPQQQQQYAAGYYQQQGYQQNPDIQMQNAQGFHQRTGQYPQQYQGQGEYDQQQYGYR